MLHDQEFVIEGTPHMCGCGKPLIRTVMGQEGDWFVGRWCGCEGDAPRPHFKSKEEAEDDLFGGHI